jgi:hypothetical protein
VEVFGNNRGRNRKINPVNVVDDNVEKQKENDEETLAAQQRRGLYVRHAGSSLRAATNSLQLACAILLA